MTSPGYEQDAKDLLTTMGAKFKVEAIGETLKYGYNLQSSLGSAFAQDYSLNNRAVVSAKSKSISIDYSQYTLPVILCFFILMISLQYMH